MNVENFLTLQEDETLFVRNAILAYQMQDEQRLKELAQEGVEAEKEAAVKQQEVGRGDAIILLVIVLLLIYIYY